MWWRMILKQILTRWRRLRAEFSWLRREVIEEIL
jgi:hypothetical protein